MKIIASMTAEDVYSDETLDEVFSDEDEIHKAKMLLTLEERAEQLGVKTKFARMVSAYKKVERQIQQAAKKKPLQSLETGEEQIKLAFKRNGKWEEIIVPKTLVTSANRIVALSGRGIAVTSENAKLLVRYLSDVENMNEKYIGVQYSSSKLG